MPKPFRYVPHSRVLQLLNSPPSPCPPAPDPPHRSVPSVRQRAVGTVLYGLNLASSYLIMLAVMACNGGIFLTVVFAMMFGHFFGSVQAPRRRGAGLFGGMPSRGLDSPVSGTWTER